MNSGVNFRRAASTPLRAILPVIFSSNTPVVALDSRIGAAEAELRSHDRCSSREAPRLLVMKIIAREKSTLRLSPSVSVALSRMPSNRFHSASDAFSISSNSTKLTFIVSV